MVFNRFVRSIAAAALVALFAVGLVRAQSTWTGAVDNNWSTPGNWSPSGVPTATTDVIIPAGAGTVNLATSSTCRSLTTARAMNVTSQLSITNGVTLQGGAVVTFNGGYFSMLTNNQSISGSGELVAQLNSSGSLYIFNGITLTIGNGVTVRTDAGTTGSSTFYLYFYNSAGSGAQLINNGIIRASGNTSRSVNFSNQTGTNNSLTNNGTIEASGGATVTITGLAWTNSGTFLINNGTLSPAGSYSSLGTVSRTGGTITLGGTLTPSPTFTISAATGSVDMANVTVQGGELAAAGGASYNVTNTSTFNNVTVSGATTLTSQMIVSGALTLSSNVTLTFNGGYLAFAGGTAQVNGTGTLLAGNNNTGSFYLNAGANVTIGSGVTVQTGSVGSSTWYFYFYQTSTQPFAGSTLTNNGTMIASGTNRSIQFSNQTGANYINSFVNAGAIQITNSGSLLVGAVGYSNSGTVTLNTGGTLSVGGRYSPTALGTLTRDTANSTLILGGAWTPLASFNLTGPIAPCTISATISGTTLTASGGASYRFDAATLSGCTINAPATYVGNSSSLDACTIGADAQMNTVVGVTGGLTLTGNPTVTFNSGYFSLSGTQTFGGTGVYAAAVSNTGAFYLYAGSNLTIGSGITVRSDTSPSSGSSQFYFYFYVGPAPGNTPSVLTNNGTILTTGTSRSMNLSNQSGTNNSFVNNGTISVLNNATFSLGTSLNFTNNGTLNLNAGTLSLNGRYTGLGTLNRTGGTINLGGDFSPTGTFTISNALGPVNINANISNATLAAIDGLAYTFTGGALNNVTITAPSAITSTVSSTGLTVSAPMVMSGQLVMTGDLTLVSQPLPAAPTPITFNGGYIQFNDGGTRQICGTGELISGLGTSGSIYVQSGSQVTICPNIVVRTADVPTPPANASTSQWYFYLYATGGTTPTGARLTNQGQLRAVGVNRQLIFSNQSGAVGINRFVNTGTVSATGATTASATVTGIEWDSTGGTTVLNTGGTLTLNGVTTPAKLGTITRDAANSTINIGGTFNIPGSTFTLTSAIGPANFSVPLSNITFSASPGLVPNFVNAGSSLTWTNVTLASPFTMNNPSYVLNSCTFSANGTIGSANLTIQSTLTLSNNAVLTVASSNFYTNAPASIVGNGSIVASNGGSNSFYIQDGSTLTIGSGITIDGFTGGAGSSGLYFYLYRLATAPNTPAQLINNGTIRSSGASRSISFYSQSAGTHLITNNGTLEFGTLTAGSSGVNIVNNGELITGPGGSLVMAQGTSLTLGPTGRYTSQINGPAGSTSTIGRLVASTGTSGTNAVPGAVISIGGTVRVQYVAGYDPTACRPPADIISRTAGAVQGTINGTFAASQVPPNATNRLPAVGYRTGDSVFYVSTSAADIATLGGAPGADGQLTADDIVLFLNAYFAGNIARADVAGLGGTAGPDGQLTADDVVYFLSSFFAGCGN